MNGKDIYFYTGAAILDNEGILQLGVSLDMNHPDYFCVGVFNSMKYLDWFESRRLMCERWAWRFNNMRGADQSYLSHNNIQYPDDVMQIIINKLGVEAGTPIERIDLNEENEKEIYAAIQLPLIKYLHERELIRILTRLSELSPQKKNPAIKPLWDFNDLARQIIKAWYIRNGLEIPRIKTPELKGTKWARFEVLVEETLSVGEQSDEELWEWKKRFSELPDYFNRYEERYGPLKQGSRAGNGLEWRTNKKFRRPRTKKSAQ